MRHLKKKHETTKRGICHFIIKLHFNPLSSPYIRLNPQSEPEEGPWA